MALSSAAFAFGLLLLMPSEWASAAEKHSGTVVAADKTQIIIEEMGPWHGPNTQPIRRTFQWSGGTRIALAERTRDGEAGWRWAFSDQPAQASDLRIGDFVTVTAEPRGAREVALEVLVVWPGTHLEIPAARKRSGAASAAPAAQRAYTRRALLLSAAAGLLAGLRRLAWGQATSVVEDWRGLTVGARGIPLGWEKFETLGGHASYDFTVVEDEGRRALDMKAAGDHSTITRELRVDLGATPILVWQWKGVSLPRGADLRERATSDAAGHLFVGWPRFPALLRSRLIGYVWDPYLPVGSIVKSAKTSTVMFIIVRSGGQGLGQWRGEARDVAADYRIIFGESPPNPRAIALSIDTNDTHSTAETLFGPIAFTAG